MKLYNTHYGSFDYRVVTGNPCCGYATVGLRHTFITSPSSSICAIVVELYRNKDLLVELLQYHVVKGAVTADKLKDGQKVSALNGDKLTIEIDDDGEVSINDDADVIQADIKACNGVSK